MVLLAIGVVDRWDKDGATTALRTCEVSTLVDPHTRLCLSEYEIDRHRVNINGVYACFVTVPERETNVRSHSSRILLDVPKRPGRSCKKQTKPQFLTHFPMYSPLKS